MSEMPAFQVSSVDELQFANMFSKLANVGRTYVEKHHSLTCVAQLF